MTWFNNDGNPKISVEDFNTLDEDYQKVIIKYITVAWYFDLEIMGTSHNSCVFYSGFIQTTTMNKFMIDKLIAKIDKKWIRCYPLRIYGFDKFYKEFFPDEDR